MSIEHPSALLLAAVLAGSCSAGGPEETRLVSRVWVDGDPITCDGPVCRIDARSETLRAADGRTATAEAFVAQWRFEPLAPGEVECGGRRLAASRGASRVADPRPDQGQLALVFDDGSAVDVYLESFVAVFDQCFETLGRWEGVAGTFEGRSGTYRRTDDLVQIEIVLTDS